MTEHNAVQSGADARSTSELVHDLTDQVSTLVRDEIQLATAELKEKGKNAGIGAGMFGAAGVVAGYGGMAAIACVVLALALVLPAWLAALIVTVALFALAGVLALVGRGRLRRGTPPVPEQAVQSVQRDIATVKEHAHR
ncbi:phage holin family protein [Labedaea rhizosphaerae]|uniref:Putative superfamily III holin-X n=1 Tax=Labedaea rhizosphaerae TaxID=598644 RepID=A0A4R6RT76_LABRH|nr:phage holin family protein [Labedaea rhizosphaerae]TDP89954.1 putative superfamily III holin-X [Labedaea rhizosphaerae]